MLRVATALFIALSILAGCGTAVAQPDVVRSNGTTVSTLGEAESRILIRDSNPGAQESRLRRPGDPCDVGDTPCWRAHIEQRRLENIYWEGLRDLRWRERVERYFAALRAAEAARANLGGYPAPYVVAGGFHMGSGRCGGDLPPCWRMNIESGGLLDVWHGRCHRQCTNSTASGKWQFLRGTWKNHRGYAAAAYAPEWVQDEKARQVWAGGRGCSHWSACGRRR